MRDSNETFFFGMATMAGLVLLGGVIVCLADKYAGCKKQSACQTSESDDSEEKSGYIPEEQCVPVNYANKSDGGDDVMSTDPCGYVNGDAYHDL